MHSFGPLKALLPMTVLFAAGLFVASAQAEDPAAPKPCTAKSFKIAEVEQACKSGGKKAATALMKKAVAKAKKAGQDMTCKTCHADLEEHTVKDPDKSTAELEKWL